jgi:SNF2 family DNA or RNA helicase
MPIATLTEARTIRVRTASPADSHWLKQIQGRNWIQSLRCWEIPGTVEALGELRRLLPSVEIHPQVEAHIDGWAQWKRQLVDLKNKPREEFTYWPHDLIDATPHAHQRAGLVIGRHILSEANAYGLWHEMGLGKTLTSLALIGDIWKDMRAPINALVVCPSSVIGVWSKEVRKFCKYPIRVVELTGSIKVRAVKIAQAKAQPFDGVTMYVVNYDVLWREAMAKALMSIDLHLMLCDEAHRLKGVSTEQSKVARRLGANCIRIAATGTPVDNLTDWYGIYRWLEPTVFGTSFGNFKDRYFFQIDIGDGRKIAKEVFPEMLAELTEKAHSYAHSASKDECLDLPARFDLVRECELEPRAMKMYQEMKQEAITFLDDNEQAIVGQHTLTRMLRLSQITGGYLKDEDGAIKVSSAKMDLFKEVVSDILPQKEKIVVFARFRAEIDGIRETLTKMKVTHGLIDGRIPVGPQRDKIIDAFQDEDEMRVLVIQVQAGGVGITLHRSSCAIFYSLGQSLIQWQQARDRIHRIGQRDECTYVNLVATGTIDEKILSALQAKQDLAHMTVHEWKRLLDA